MKIHDIGRKGIGITDIDGAVIRGLSIENLNLKAQHAQSHDAAGVKLFNTNNVVIKDSYFNNMNSHSIWNDTTNKIIRQLKITPLKMSEISF